MFKGTNRKILYIVVITTALLLALSSIAMAYVGTDQQDYTPGSTVTIYGDNSDGAGYLVGETVHVDVSGPNGYEATCEAVADDAGAWSCTVTLNGDESAVGEYSYIATGQDSGVSQSGMFTDGNAKFSGSVKDSSNNPIEGASINCTLGCDVNPPTAITDASGAYPKTSMPIKGSGCTTIELTASKDGFTSQTKSQNVCQTSPPTEYTLDFILNIACTPPSVTNPSDQIIIYGNDASFTVAGANYTNIKWQVSTNGGTSWNDITGATSTSYSLTMPEVSMSGYQYRAVLTGDCGDPAISEAATLTVNKATATCNISGYTGVYDGNAHGASGECTDGTTVLSGVDLGASFTDVPGGTAHWSFSNANYNGQSGDVAIVISKADPTCSIDGYTGIYDGDPHGATGSCKGVKGETLAGLDLGASFTNVPGGTANWTFTDVTGNYNNKSGTAAIVLSKADPACSIDGYTGTYDGYPHGATGSCKGVKGETLAGLDLGASFTNVPGGTANWTFTDVTGNYNNKSGTAAIVLSKADPTCSIDGYTGTYDGDPHGATGSCTGVKGEILAGLDLGASFTNVPGGTAYWTFTDVTGNYNDDDGSVDIVISKANPTCSVTPYNVIYDGIPHTATGSCTGVKGEVLSGLNLNGTTHTIGDYPADPWAFTDVTGNYNNTSGTVHDSILYSTGSCYGGPGHSILQSINADGSSVFKQKSTVPAKFRVCDAFGNSVGTPGVVSSFRLIQIINGTVATVDEAVDSTTPDTAFRWSADGQQWIFNINTKSLTSGKTYVYLITLNDGSTISFQFGLK
jgi:hypothetical protein